MWIQSDKSPDLNGTTCHVCRCEIIILRGHATSDMLRHNEWRRKNGCTGSAFLPNHCVRISSAPGMLSGSEYGGHRWAIRSARDARLPSESERVATMLAVELKSELMRKVFGVR